MKLKLRDTYNEIPEQLISLHHFLTGWEEPGFDNQHLATTGKPFLLQL